MKKQLLFLFASALCTGNYAQAQQTIPNASFENWTNFGTYSDPVSWLSLNSQFVGMGLIPNCEKGTPGASGTSYLKLTIKSDAAPSVIKSTTKSLSKTPPGFAYNLRPTAFKGKWQYLTSVNDSSFAVVTFSKWNSASLKSDIIGGGSVLITAGSVSTWTDFNIQITFQTTDYPDSATITFAVGIGNTPVVNDFLYIDDLSFSGTTGINEVQEKSTFSVSPNPSNGIFSIQNLGEGISNIAVFNLLGERVYQFSNNSIANGAQTEIDLSTKPKGIYFIQVTSGKSVTNKKIILE